jgi:hypothetical protein
LTSAPPEGTITIKLPAPGTWTLAVWLTDAAGHTNPDNAAIINITVPTSKTQPPTENPQNNNTPPQLHQTSTPRKPNTTTRHSTKPRPHIKLRLRNNQLLIEITELPHGPIRITYSARHQGHLLSSASRYLKKPHNKTVKARFRLSPYAVKHATITVTVRIRKNKLLTSTTWRFHGPQ